MFTASVICLICFQTCKDTQDVGALTKAADFVKAFVLGFQVEVSMLVEASGELCVFDSANIEFLAKFCLPAEMKPQELSVKSTVDFIFTIFFTCSNFFVYPCEYLWLLACDLTPFPPSF